MALIPNDPQHKMQIEAGTVGRKRGHKFEATLSSAINAMNNKHFVPLTNVSPFHRKSSRIITAIHCE